MDFFNAMLLLIAVFMIAVTLYGANRAAIGESIALIRAMLSVLLMGMALFTGVMVLSTNAVDGYNPVQPVAMVGITAFVIVISIGIMNSVRLRVRIRAALPAAATYNPDSIVHTTAIVLMLLAISYTLSNFAASGGLSGVAEGLSAGISLVDVAFSQGLWLIGAVMGIGFAVRRGFPEALARLGLRFPTVRSLAVGVTVGGGMVIFAFAFTIVWLLFASPEVFAQQTAASSQVAQSFNTIGLAFGLSIMAAIGEEIFFRGALQPVFGNIVTSLFFIALHTQYTLTPASVMLFFTSLAFGWLRDRYGTTAAIVGHFVYNFVQLALAASAAP